MWSPGQGGCGALGGTRSILKPGIGHLLRHPFRGPPLGGGFGGLTGAGPGLGLIFDISSLATHAKHPPHAIPHPHLTHPGSSSQTPLTQSAQVPSRVGGQTMSRSIRQAEHPIQAPIHAGCSPVGSKEAVALPPTYPYALSPGQSGSIVLQHPVTYE